MRSPVKYFLPLWMTLIIRVQADDFVYDYFRYKNVSRVTIFSCEQTKYDFRFVRKMNELGISVAVNHPTWKSYNISSSVVRKDYWPFGLFVDTRCQSRKVNEKIIAQASNYRLYDDIDVWLILGSSLDKVSRMLNDTAYGLLTDLVIGVTTNAGFDLYDVYNPCKIRGGNLNITRLGTWARGEGLNITDLQSKFDRRSNLHGLKVLAVGVVKYRPPGMSIEDYLQDYATKSKDPVTKYGYAILRQIADLFNFTIEVLSVQEWIDTENGTEVGMMPMLYNGEADFALTSASAILRYGMKPYGRMIGPGYPYRTFFLFRSSITKVKWMELLTPFAIHSWYATLLTAVLSTMIITTIQMTEYDEGWFAESGHAIFATLGVFCQQGLVFVPNRLAGRIACLFLLILGVLLSNYYGASVVSARLNEPPDKMNDSLYSLAKSQMSLASEPYRNVDDMIKARSVNEWEARYFNEKIWSKLPPSTKFTLPEIGLGKIINGDYAYHTSAEVAYPYVDANWDEKAICDMTEVHVVTPRMLTFWERTNSPFTEIMTVGLFKIANTGLRTRTIKRWKPKIPYCSPVARSLQSITFFEIAPAVLVVLIGTTMAAIVFCVECILYKLRPVKRKAQTRQKKARVGGKRALLRNYKK